MHSPLMEYTNNSLAGCNIGNALTQHFEADDFSGGRCTQ